VTVKELIEELKKAPPDIEVRTFDYEFCSPYPIDYVEILKDMVVIN